MLLQKALSLFMLSYTSLVMGQTLVTPQVSDISKICPQATTSRLRELSTPRFGGGGDGATVINFRRISSNAQQFSLEFLTKTSEILLTAKQRRNFMISPFSIWALLLLLTEASEKNTYNELRTVLHIQDDKETLRAAFNEVQQYLQWKTDMIDVATLQAMFVDAYEWIDPLYKLILTKCYDAVVYDSIQFNDTATTTQFINKVIREATRGLIEESITPQIVRGANLLLTSTIYFRGQWKLPFNSSFTRSEPFYDEEGNVVGNAEMMTQTGVFKYAGMANLDAHVLELPYGVQDRLSMLVILPKKGVSIHNVVQNLQQVGIAAIFEKLTEMSTGFEDEDVEVFLPKFDTATKLNVESILQQMGIREIFDPQTVDFSSMSKRLYVQSILHSTKIIVDEVGTRAAAATTAVLANKSSPPKFYLNRPFLYLIVEKYSNLVIFAGQIVNPSAH